MLGYAAGQMQLPIELVQEADRLGVHSVWTAEAYGSDAVSPLAWLGALTTRIHLGTAIMQMPGRTPANAAMTAMTLNQLSGGRFDGPGCPGRRWSRAGTVSPRPTAARTREYVAIVRAIFRREAPLTSRAATTRYPYHGDDATARAAQEHAEGRPEHPPSTRWPSALNVELAAGRDGWLPIFFAPEQYTPPTRPTSTPLAKAGKTIEYRHRPTVSVVINDNLDVC
jgi:alkanesulfonate monooxygenase SsuD/methylene tetrahydromethanopterin reductase-like flavin-dependent oxidoreductase (luciferase family)